MDSDVLVVGCAGGVGTTTVAAALGVRDGGVYTGQPHAQHAQLVVCADTVASVGLAHRVIHHVSSRPVLVVVAATSSGIGRVAKARVDMVSEQVTGVVHVPHVARWREIADPWAQAAAVRLSPQQVPRWLQKFAERIRQIARLVGEQEASAPTRRFFPVAQPEPRSG